MSAALSQDSNVVQGKQPEPLDPTAVTQTAEDRRTPMQIMLEDSSTSTTHELTPSLRSPMDIILEDSPASSKASSKSSSSVTISDHSSGLDFGAHPPVLDHSSFYAEGSLRDRTLANLDMVVQTPKAPLFEIKDLCEPMPATSLSVDGKTCREAQEKDKAFTGRELRETGLTLGTERGGLTTAGHQKPLMPTRCEQEESSRTEVTGRGMSTELPVLPGLQSEVLPLLQQLLHNHRSVVRVH